MALLFFQTSMNNPSFRNCIRHDRFYYRYRQHRLVPTEQYKRRLIRFAVAENVYQSRALLRTAAILQKQYRRHAYLFVRRVHRFQRE